MHFTRKKHDLTGDLKSTVQINGHPAQLQESSLRILGVWVDPKLTWRKHIAHAARKGTTSFEALSRIAASTWGPSMRRSRLIYSAVVRPALLYGAQIWGASDNGQPIIDNRIQPLRIIQNRCLRRITGGYKRTPIAALERETGIPPLDLYIDATAMQRAITIKNHRVENDVHRALDDIWTSAVAPRPRRARPPRAAGGRERLLKRALEREAEMREFIAHHAETAEQTPRGRRTARGRGRQRPYQQRPHQQGGHRHRYKATTLITLWADLQWRKRWERTAQNRRASTWNTPWTAQTVPLYEGLTKAEATALFLLRTEVLGLKAWLASIQVPGILPRCPCGWPAQTVRHIMLQCPQYDRVPLIAATQTESLSVMLSERDRVGHAARWFLRQGILEQFRTAQEIAQENLGGFAPLPELSNWS